MEEFWLSGTVTGVTPLLMPAAHTLLQAARDISEATENLSIEELWTEPFGANSVGFGLKHVAGSIDRLLTYSLDEQLSTIQLALLSMETEINAAVSSAALTACAVEKIREAIGVIRAADEKTLFAPRAVGRKRLPTNVFGLLFHIAEHTQRHVGQIITTAEIVRNTKKL